ncbi:metalloregulator ArsR/SmtB family transcription factor [Pseudarthrobacter raffinosi]|uniref:metalloregulator ArsR/SmtB family transcription factor n=1 Tax=Pseudarthrobacter raffinosi TaxID=2953651 RepID=UPI00208F226E|nr:MULTISPECIES: metalloregulator ArsR/SmtB family transcription factor [unclassified Pseudarthrobacter]MCO4238913.1 metalloregulator ArsR/SmtB family transcription factor [Pseudarthrobacter sp. MDT3-28]MCO4265198.1 metalloregulator ArsR/SmtB family transcription factor [Pseudarthrobacter sp. MDT3-26]
MNRDAYAHVARIGKAISSGNRLELLELLAQAEQSVDSLSRLSGMGVTTVSAHLQVLKGAGLVRTRRDGTRIHYRLAGPEVAGLFVAMKNMAARVLPGLSTIDGEKDSGSGRDDSVPLIRTIEEIREAYMLDVRPAHEYQAGHYPGAASIPLDELASRIGEVPRDRRVIVYCRGEFCRLARDAARLMRGQGIDAYAMDEGVLEWRASGDVDLTATA